MRIKAVLIVTFAIFFAISALIFHLLALFSKRWIVAIPRHSRGPNDQIHYYGLWTRCQYSNTSFVIPDISSQPNIENFVCRPNTYLRYDFSNPEIRQKCYESRHQCSSIIGVHSDCKCQYLPSTRIQQWFSILASVFLLLAIIILYMKLIASAQTKSATFLLTFAPVVFFTSALLLMIITMILVGVYLRRNEYEDYDIRLPKSSFSSLAGAPDTFNFFRLKSFFKIHKDPEIYFQTLSEFRAIHNERFHARIDWSAGAEIIAIILTCIAQIISVVLAVAEVNQHI